MLTSQSTDTKPQENLQQQQHNNDDRDDHDGHDGHDDHGDNDYDNTSTQQQQQQQQNIATESNESQFHYNVGVRIDSVQLEGLVLLRIIKHCSAHMTQQQGITGQVYGIDEQNENGKNILQITHSIPYPENFDEKKYGKLIKEYSRDQRADDNIVGWYRISFGGTFVTQATITEQHNYQKLFPHAVILVYDPSLTNLGQLSIRAFQLTDKYMKFLEKNDFTSASIAQQNIYSTDILRELPIQIHNSHLVHAFLFELRENHVLNCGFNRFNHGHSYQFQMNLRKLTSTIDAYEIESNKFREFWRKCRNRHDYIEKKMRDNKYRTSRGQLKDINSLFPKEDEPSRNDSILICSQMTQYINQIDNGISQALGKVWITQGLHNDQYL